MRCAVEGRDNPLAEQDLEMALAKGVARSQQVSIGKALSTMLRKSLQPVGSKTALVRNGLRVIARPQTAQPVSMEIVNKLRDEV